MTLVVSDVGHLFREYRGRETVFENWKRSDIKFTPGTPEYEQYFIGDLYTIVLKVADTIILPPGTFFELYAATDLVVATNYFYSLHTLSLTEFSRRYDTLFTPPKQDLHRVAYLSLSRLMCNFPFSGDTIHLNAVLALCSMVLNPAYYSNRLSCAREDSEKIQASARRYLCIVDSQLDRTCLQWSLSAQTVHPVIPPVPLEIEASRFIRFHYPLQDDIELALECAHLIETHLGKNSQQFTVAVDHRGQAVFNGMDFAAVANYQWNPLLDNLGLELREFCMKRL